MTNTVRLLADDLTGALDTAAELVGLIGNDTLHAYWHGAVPSPLPANASLDSGTRELGRAAAEHIVSGLTPALMGASIAYKKIDSLMRGPTLAEAAVCFRAGGWERAVLAPAFPHQGRATIGGVQHVRDGTGGWLPLANGDIVARLGGEGVRVHRGEIDAPLRPGISVFDAIDDATLRRVAVIGKEAPGRVLWIGTGGLAQALAADASADASAPLPLPILGLFGSDQAVTAGQLAACGTDWLHLRDGGAVQAAVVAARLQTAGRAMVSLHLPAGLTRDDAALRIAGELRRLIEGIAPPGTLIVAGGETLRGLCLSLGAHGLEVKGRIVPGLPRSILRGGPWTGVTVISKSGAFGPPTMLRDLLGASHITTERTP